VHSKIDRFPKTITRGGFVKISTIGACVFFVAFSAFSVKVKRDVARKEAMDSFSGGLSYGDVPPRFELAASDGTLHRLDEAVPGKKVVLLNFWATWCPPCRLEMPQLQTLHERYRDKGLQILAINVEEDEKTVRDFLSQRTLSFPVLLDREGLVAARYGVEAFPTTVLLDAEGKVFDVTEGLDPYLAYTIESMLEDDGESEEGS
jgi:thiol-disulfide isomerase/thioredoxin